MKGSATQRHIFVPAPDFAAAIHDRLTLSKTARELQPDGSRFHARVVEDKPNWFIIVEPPDYRSGIIIDRSKDWMARAAQR